MTRKLTLLLLIAFIAQTCLAQTFNKGKMDSLLDVLNNNNKAMVSVAVMQNGKLLYNKATGYSWYGTQKTAANTQTKYRIGSVSKVFTAAIIFQLIEEGKLKLTTPLSTFYPALPNAAKITIAQMLNHSSGIHSFTSDSSYTSWLNQKVTPANLLSKMTPSSFEPGTKHAYSNSNFVLLGYIAEKLDKKPYATILKQRITNKIGLKNTYYGSKITAAGNEAYSYTWNNGWIPETETDMSIPGGAGAVVSTPTDLTKFMDALFKGKLVSPASLTQMTTIKDGYGMNLFSLPFNNHASYGHNGSIDGFRSQASYFPKEDIAVAYITNGSNTNLNNMMIGLLSIVFNTPYKIPDFKQVLLKTEDLDQYLGVYSTPQIPLKVTVTKRGTTLVAEGTGQSAFDLDAGGNHKFTFDPAGIILLFDPAAGQMTLKQGGGTLLFTREK